MILVESYNNRKRSAVMQKSLCTLKIEDMVWEGAVTKNPSSLNTNQILRPSIQSGFYMRDQNTLLGAPMSAWRYNKRPNSSFGRVNTRAAWSAERTVVAAGALFGLMLRGIYTQDEKSTRDRERRSAHNGWALALKLKPCEPRAILQKPKNRRTQL